MLKKERFSETNYRRWTQCIINQRKPSRERAWRFIEIIIYDFFWQSPKRFIRSNVCLKICSQIHISIITPSEKYLFESRKIYLEILGVFYRGNIGILVINSCAQMQIIRKNHWKHILEKFLQGSFQNSCVRSTSKNYFKDSWRNTGSIPWRKSAWIYLRE